MSVLSEEKIETFYPTQLAFGNGCTSYCFKSLISRGSQRVFIILSSSAEPLVSSWLRSLESECQAIQVWTGIDKEPTVSMFEEALSKAQEFSADAVLGIGGGSVLDVAKLVAALLDGKQKIQDILGIGNLAGRSTFLACLPTTAGTGSEVSPNAILLDETESLKKGAISPYLVPDVTYIDPELTKTVPPDITAATGLDALTHCIEAYANRYSHPMIDLYALEGIELIGLNLEQAVKHGDDTEARTKVALGSMYGGLCLGPVNTAAVHALSYPLGSEYQVPHGISNAVLLPYVLEFNLEAAPDRYADIAGALGVRENSSDLNKAKAGVGKLKKLMERCNVPLSMKALDVPEDAIGDMASAAMTIERLLKNNVRSLTRKDAVQIYEAAF